MGKFVESQILELKSSLKDDVKKEIIAFANTSGGEIYIGIDDGGTIVGLGNINKELERASNMIHDGIKPDLSPFTKVEIIKIEDKDILKISVFKGEKAPYYLSEKGLKPSGVYIRHGSISTQASDEYIRKMIRDNDRLAYESLISHNQELTFLYADKLFNDRKLLFGEVQKKSLGLINDSNEYTNLGLLISDQCESKIKCASYLGITKEVFKDRKEFSGSLFKQLDDVYEYICNNHNAVSSIISGLYREDTYEYPNLAIREALLNCIVHKDYDFNSHTLIHIFTDRIEFLNVGGLMNGVSMEIIMIGVSITRNTKLADIFYRLKLIESYGTGISRILDSYVDVLVKPNFISKDQAFLVMLPNLKNKSYNSDVIKEDKFSIQEEIIINYLKDNKFVNRKTVEQITGLSKTSSIDIINSLIYKNAIISIGNGRAIKYYST